MNHLVVVEIERKPLGVMIFASPGTEVIIHPSPCWNILFKIPCSIPMIYDDAIDPNFNERSIAFTGCLSWIENNKVEGSKYAIVKMYLIP